MSLFQRLLITASLTLLILDTLPIESLSEFLTALYYGSPPESELNRLNDLIQEYVKDRRISWVSK